MYYTTSTLTLTFIRNSAAELVPHYIRNFSPTWCQNPEVTRNRFSTCNWYHELTRYSTMPHEKTISFNAKMVITKVYNYFMKLSKYWATRAPLKRTFQATGFKAFMQSVMWRVLSSLTMEVLMRWNTKGMPFLTYTICQLLLSQSFIAARFKTCWVSHRAESNDPSPVTTAQKMASLSVFSERRSECGRTTDKHTICYEMYTHIHPHTH